MGFGDWFGKILTGERLVKDPNDKAFKDFAPEAFDTLSKNLAPEIIGLDEIKQAAVLQLFSIERLHILLLGDPGCGKSVVLKSAVALHPLGRWGIGSGTSGVGIAAGICHGRVEPGLLPLAHGGVCGIDELNLMKTEDLGHLFCAMESGYVAYDKGGFHTELPASVRVIAAANPKGDKFVGKDIIKLRKQLPFETAMLTRFHLTFMVREANAKDFAEITARIGDSQYKEHSMTKERIDFVHDYIKYAWRTCPKMSLPADYNKKTARFFKNLKKNEDKFLVPVSPRLVVGIKRLCMASARLELRSMVEDKDIERATKLMKASLVIR